MAKTLIALVVVLVVALGLQIVGVVSMPVTKTISIASYDGHRFGLWGYCDSNGGSCTDIALGYPSDEALPNASMSVLSKLLIVHVVAAGCTLIMLLLVLVGFCGNRKYILALSLLAVPSFLVSLLAFLAEILLFTRHLDFAGWFVLASVVLNGFVIVLLCLQHRHLGDKWKGSTPSSEGDDEKLINTTKPYQESVDTTNQSDVFEPKRHVERSFNAPTIAEANERPGYTPSQAGFNQGASSYGQAQNQVQNQVQNQGQNQGPPGSRYGQPRYQQGQSQAPNQLLGDPRSRAQGPPRPRNNGPVAASSAMAGAGTGAPTFGRGQGSQRMGQGRGPNQGVNTQGLNAQGPNPQGPTGQYPSHGYSSGPRGAPPTGAVAPIPPAHSNAHSDSPSRPAPVRKDTEFQQRAKPVQRDDFDFGGSLPPAGADIAGMEDARSSFGPSVVPVPRVRKIDTAELDDGEETRAGNTPTGTPHMVRGMSRDESHVGIVQYAQPERAVPNFSRQNHSPTDPAAAFRDMIPSEPVTHARVSDSPQRTTRVQNMSRQQQPIAQGPDMHHQMGHQMAPPSQQGPESNRLMERFIQELPPSQEYFDYSSEQDHIPPTPHSPGGSDFTSVSQRAEHGGNQPRGSTGFAPAQRRAADRNDMVLNANPDFAIPGSGRGGRRGRGRGGRR